MWKYILKSEKFKFIQKTWHLNQTWKLKKNQTVYWLILSLNTFCLSLKFKIEILMYNFKIFGYFFTLMELLAQI